MAEISYRGHRFPSAIIQHAVWPYLRFTPSYRDVEELLARIFVRAGVPIRGVTVLPASLNASAFAKA
jgi:hypothetical protein